MSYSPSCMEEEDLRAWLGLGIGGGGEGGCSPSRSHGERWSSVQFDKQDEMSGCGYEQAENKKSDDKGRTRKRCPSPSEEEDDGGDGGARKKLQLSKEQATLLEDTFRSHNILSYAQKHELARRVNLTPRQVEVWFQNRRARTKLKQTEVDREILKRCCESLTVENQRLKHELVGLQRSGAVAGLYVVDNQFPRAAPADTVSVCPSCEKVTLTSVGDTSNKSSSYSS